METPRLVGLGAYLVALLALFVALYRRVAEWDRNQDELDRRKPRAP